MLSQSGVAISPVSKGSELMPFRNEPKTSEFATYNEIISEQVSIDLQTDRNTAAGCYSGVFPVVVLHRIDQ